MTLECIAPDEISTGDLLAYIDDDIPAYISQHIRNCPFCTQEVADLEKMQQLFAKTLFRESCPELDFLLQYQAGLLNKAEKRGLKQHLQTCPHCQEEIAQIEAVTFAIPAKPSTLEQLREKGRQIIQAVLMPPPPQPALALRGNQEHSLFYEADGYQIIIAKKPPLVAAAKVWQIEGQINRQDDPLAQLEGVASLQQNDEPVYQDSLDEFGYFVMENVNPGSYNLQIDLTSTQIIIQEFVVL
jgi:hypothetical protein